MALYDERDRWVASTAAGEMRRTTVEQAIAGDHEAFTELARASMDRLYAVASLILRDSDSAHDAVQDSLITAWRDIRALRNPDAWEAWLHRLTVRACYKHARKRKRGSLLEAKIKATPRPEYQADFTASLAERERIEQELGRLNLDQRAVVVLHFYAGLPLTRVAAVLDIPEGTAKSRLHYALKTLRGAMSEQTEGDPRPAMERTA